MTMLRMAKPTVLLVLFALCCTTQVRVANCQLTTISEDNNASFAENLRQLGPRGDLSDADNKAADHEDSSVKNGHVVQPSKKTLRHRHRTGHELKGSRILMSSSSSRSGKGKGGSSYYSRSFLDRDIEPKPFVNCIPPPPGHSKSYGSKSKSKGKGRRHRRKSRRRRRSSSSRGTSISRRDLRGSGKGGGSVSSSDRRGRGRRHRGRADKLPYCPPETLAPTFLPTVTPFPTVTPLPTVTPFPSITPVPTVGPVPTATPTVSSQPSVSSRPTVTPGSPTKGPTTTPPTGGTTRTVPARLGYAFFDRKTTGQTQAEIDGLIEQTVDFYFDLLSAEFGNSFQSFELRNDQDSFSTSNTYQSILDFDAVVGFTGNNPPTQDEVFEAMSADSATYQDYIQNYVWESEPLGTSIFFDTEMVMFSTRGTNFG